MKYSYRLQNSAHRYLKRLPPEQATRVLTLLARLCDDPFDDVLSTPLHGRMAGLRRARAGGTRVVFRVVRDELLIFVTAIGPRGDVYKG